MAPTILQAILDIEAQASEINAVGLRHTKIYVMSDSQAALKALRYVFDSKVVWECLNNLKQLAILEQYKSNAGVTARTNIHIFRDPVM